MRLEFEDEDLRLLAKDSTHVTKRWAPRVTQDYRRRIQQLRAATSEQDLRALKALHLHKLMGDLQGLWAINIDKKYRLILQFRTDEAGRVTIIIDGRDYH